MKIAILGVVWVVAAPGALASSHKDIPVTVWMSLDHKLVLNSRVFSLSQVCVEEFDR